MNHFKVCPAGAALIGLSGMNVSVQTHYGKSVRVNANLCSICVRSHPWKEDSMSEHFTVHLEYHRLLDCGYQCNLHVCMHFKMSLRVYTV